MFVCAHCFEDAELANYIKGLSIDEACSFCSDATVGAAYIEDVASHIRSCLYQDYDDAVNQLYWDSDERVYQGCHWDTYELLFDHLGLYLPRDKGDRLMSAILDHIGYNFWCETNPYGPSDQEVAIFSWNRFCNIVMHHRRFFFLNVESESYGHEVHGPAKVLKNIFDYAREIGLFKTLPSGTQLYRARWDDTETLQKTARDLGPPPQEKATQSNRMSPPGIVMFYACDEIETALLETASGPGRFAVARFETRRPATILDLTSIPSVPSLFGPPTGILEFRPRKPIMFLRHLAEHISRPIKRDQRVHVDYVPTQVVTEFIRSQTHDDQAQVDGIKYDSSVHSGHSSYVLFASQDNMRSPKSNLAKVDQWLELVGMCHCSV